jgi:hypothetical protein
VDDASGRRRDLLNDLEASFIGGNAKLIRICLEETSHRIFKRVGCRFGSFGDCGQLKLAPNLSGTPCDLIAPDVAIGQ